MSLDDRLRGTYQRQVDEVQRELAARPAVSTGRTIGAPLAGRLVAMAAALLVVAAGALAIVRLTEDNSGSIQTDAGASTVVDQTTPPTAQATVVDEPTTSPPTASTAEADTTQPASTQPSTTQPATTQPSTTQLSTTQSSTAQDSTTQSSTAQDSTTQDSTTLQATTLPTSAGVASAVCPSGARAELEAAATRYVGENRGWGRKDDLVDEQNARYYFEAWEPNYELPVLVEVTLTEPVRATDIRVFQDPFTPVAGTITIDIGDEQVGIELSGTDGWRVHDFAEPIVVDRFTIRRDAPESNIMEVMLCL